MGSSWQDASKRYVPPVSFCCFPANLPRTHYWPGRWQRETILESSQSQSNLQTCLQPSEAYSPSLPRRGELYDKGNHQSRITQPEQSREANRGDSEHRLLTTKFEVGRWQGKYAGRRLRTPYLRNPLPT